MASIFLLAGCSESNWIPASPPVDTDARCSSARQCQSNELCVDGTCRPYRWYTRPDLGEVHDGGASYDAMDAGDAVELVDTEVPFEVLHDVAQDIESEVNIGIEVSEDVLEEDSSDVLPPPKTLTAVVQSDNYEEGKGEVTVALGIGEAWAADLAIPLDGSYAGMQVVVEDLLSDDSCGIFRPVLFGTVNGKISDTPTWTSEETFELAGDSKPQFLFTQSSVPVSKGDLRVGLRYEATCEEGSKPPLLVTDTSGVSETSWYWKGTPDQSPWIPGSFLGLDGRWVLRLLLEVPM